MIGPEEFGAVAIHKWRVSKQHPVLIIQVEESFDGLYLSSYEEKFLVTMKKWPGNELGCVNIKPRVELIGQRLPKSALSVRFGKNIDIWDSV